jgi:hypothetical protein
MCCRRLRAAAQLKYLTVTRDALKLVDSEKGKPVERRGRKATGLKERGSYDGGAATVALLARPLALPTRSTSYRIAALYRSVAFHDGWVRGSYDITNAKYGCWRGRARRSSGVGGA